MKITIRDWTQKDTDNLNAVGMNGNFLAEEGRKVVTCTDNVGNSGIMYLESEIIDRLGVDYISKHIALEYSHVCEEWFPKLSQNDYYNDPAKFPPKTIYVEFIKNKEGEKTEVYQNVDNGRYYLRQLCNEPFARWLTCHEHQRYEFVDDSEVRANITFIHKGETETVIYDDWNGNAAYSKTFNPNFNRM